MCPLHLLMSLTNIDMYNIREHLKIWLEVDVKLNDMSLDNAPLIGQYNCPIRVSQSESNLRKSKARTIIEHAVNRNHNPNPGQKL